jgi:hypothetical protein
MKKVCENYENFVHTLKINKLRLFLIEIR